MARAGGHLSDLGARLETLSEQLEEVTRQYKEAWTSATKSGWTPSQLRSFGLKPPTKTRGRSTARKTASRTTKPATPTANNELA